MREEFAFGLLFTCVLIVKPSALRILHPNRLSDYSNADVECYMFVNRIFTPVKIIILKTFCEYAIVITG